MIWPGVKKVTNGVCMPFLYAFGRFFARIWCKLGGCHIMGRENIPAQGAFLVIANHSSFADPILLAIIFPQHITFIAKEQFKRQGFTRWLFGNGLGAVFLSKEESDMSALRTAIKLLKNGRTVGIFPEWHRNTDQKIGQFMPGAVYIALKAAVPVIPVAIYNGRELRRLYKRQIVVNIGQPIKTVGNAKITQEELAAQAGSFQQIVAELFRESEHYACQGV